MTTKRCNIKPITESDFDDIIPLFTNNEVRRFLGGPISIEWAFNKLKESLQLDNDIRFVVREKNTQTCIGIIIIAPHHNPADMEISYMFMPEFWGMGFASEVLKRLLEFCREELKLSRIVAETQTANTRSCQLLEKFGYMLESKVERFGAEQSIYVYNFSNTIIRKADASDINALIKLRLDYLTDNRGSLTDLDTSLITAQLKGYYSTHIGTDFYAYLAELDGEIVSTAFLVIIEKPANPAFITGKIGTVLNVYTYPHHRHKGIATAILKYLIETAMVENLSYLELSATPSGKMLYEKLGFVAKQSKYTDMKLIISDKK